MQIGPIESNNDVIISFNCILWDINLKGLKVLNNLNTFKNCKDEFVWLPTAYFSIKISKSNIEQITIIISILFQLSLK